MFDGIRDKIQNLQENLSTTLRELSVVDKQPDRRPAGKTTPSVNYYAGTAVLEKFQSHWSDLHENSQENATKAEKVDDLISNLQKSADKQCKEINNLTRLLISLPDIVKSVNDLHDKIVNLGMLFEEVKNGLVLLEDVLDVRDFENKVFEQKLQLSLHKHTRLAQLESLRIYLEKKERSRAEDFNRKFSSQKEAMHMPPFSPSIFESAKINEGDEDSNALEDIVIVNENPENLEAFLNDSQETFEPTDRH